MTGSELMTAMEAAARLGVSQPTINRWAASGRLRALRTSPLLFDAAEVEREAAELAEEARARAAHLAGEAVS